MSSNRSCPTRCRRLSDTTSQAPSSGVGAKVRRFKEGDQVYARPETDQIGTFAERVAVAEADLALRPTTITAVEAR